MKNKKGFTLIELLVTITIMLSITAVAIVSITKISKKNKEDAKKRVEQQIKAAAEQYFSNNKYLFEGMTDGFGFISVKMLNEKGYVGVLTDPTTAKKINECSYVEVTKTGNDYEFEYTDNNSTEKCDYYQGVTVMSKVEGLETPNPNMYTIYFAAYDPELKKYSRRIYLPDLNKGYINIDLLKKTIGELYDNNNPDHNKVYLGIDLDSGSIKNIQVINSNGKVYNFEEPEPMLLGDNFDPKDFTIIITDANDNKYTRLITFGKDTKYPYVDDSGTTYDSTQTNVSLIGYDTLKLKIFKVDGNIIDKKNNLFAFTDIIKDGTKNYDIYIEDAAGNKVSQTISKTFKYKECQDGNTKSDDEYQYGECTCNPDGSASRTVTITKKEVDVNNGAICDTSTRTETESCTPLSPCTQPDKTSPVVTVKVYKTDKNGNKSGSPVATGTFSGSNVNNNVLNVNAGNWYSYSQSPSGVIITADSSEDGYYYFHWNQGGLSISDADNNSNYGWKGTNYGGGANNWYYTNDKDRPVTSDGARRLRYHVYDWNGNGTMFVVKINLDMHSPSVTYKECESTSSTNWSYGCMNSACPTDNSKTCKFYVSYEITDSLSGVDTSSSNKPKRYWNSAGLTAGEVEKTSNAWDSSTLSYGGGNSANASISLSGNTYYGTHYTTSAGDGARKLKVTACDKAGNCNRSSEQTSYLDWTISVSNISVSQRKKKNNSIDRCSSDSDLWYNVNLTGTPLVSATSITADSTFKIKNQTACIVLEGFSIKIGKYKNDSFTFQKSNITGVSSNQYSSNGYTITHDKVVTYTNTGGQWCLSSQGQGTTSNPCEGYWGFTAVKGGAKYSGQLKFKTVYK